jgi:hypothetical protein
MPSTTSQFAPADDGERLWSGESRDLTSANAFWHDQDPKLTLAD